MAEKNKTRTNPYKSVRNKGKQAALAGESRDSHGYRTEGKGSGFGRFWLKGYDSVPADKRGSQLVEGGVLEEVEA